MSEYIIKCKEFVSISGKTMKFPEYIDLNQEIVRCRDCKWYMAYMAGAYCDYMAHAVELDGFCAWAIRRDA